jgi:hypothetical protein
MVLSKGRACVGFCSGVRTIGLLAVIVFTFLGLGNAVTAACTATEKNADYSADNGSEDTATVSANVNGVGDLVAITAYCYSSCTFVNVTLGGQTATKTTVSGPGISGSPGNGQGAIFYVASAASSGSQTLTLTVSGSHTDVQTSYIDFSPSAGCKFIHNVDSPLGAYPGSPTDTSQGSINAPSITPSTGDLLFNFTWTSEHVDSVNSPWSCPQYNGPGESQTCEFVNTINAAAYILSAPSGSTANNMTDIHNTDNWQGLISSFTISNGAPPPIPPTGLAALVN